MYYKKYSEIPPIPEDIKRECIQFAEENIKNGVPWLIEYSGYDTTNKDSLAYVEAGKEHLDSNGKPSGGVKFYLCPNNITTRLAAFYKEQYPPLSNNNFYLIQVVTGGSFVGPHIDNPVRSPSLLFLLKSGGENVRTRWYEPKDEFKNLPITPNRSIPYDKLDLVEDHRLEEDTWHWMNFSKMHSVENQESLRLGLWGFNTTDLTILNSVGITSLPL